MLINRHVNKQATAYKTAPYCPPAAKAYRLLSDHYISL